jgi:lysophospholipase L1-like esterase
LSVVVATVFGGAKHNLGGNIMKRTAVAVLAAASLLVGVPASAHSGWTGTWASSPVEANEGFEPNWSQLGFDNQTVRQVVRISAGGERTRIRLSNSYGKTPLEVAGATIARTDQGASVRPGSVRQLTFGHSRSTVIPAGAEIASDAAPLAVDALDRLTVTLYFAKPSGPVTFHPFASATSYRAWGDHRSDASAAAFSETTHSWYLLRGVDVQGESSRGGAVVAFGDSITDGALSTVDADNRYPDELAERLRGRVGVLNEGIGGNRLLNGSPCFGDAGVRRFARDVLGRPNVRTVVVLEGINDIHASAFEFECFVPNPKITVDELIAGHRSLIHQAHAKGVRAIGATLTPFKGSGGFTPDTEAMRDGLNAWIRTSGEYDAVVDLERVVADPTDGDAILPAYDSGDHIHPNDAGYHAMANAVARKI